VQQRWLESDSLLTPPMPLRIAYKTSTDVGLSMYVEESRRELTRKRSPVQSVGSVQSPEGGLLYDEK
jgi:hypothetical protein